MDDHANFRASAKRVLESAGYQVVGEAVDAEDAVTKIRRLRPDVLLLDIQLPGRNGFELAAQLAAEARPPTIVLTSSREATDYGSQLAGAHIAGFIHKPALSRVLLAGFIEACSPD